jgi:hypothetical protein
VGIAVKAILGCLIMAHTCHHSENILRERNTASLQILTLILNTLNGTLWTAHGVAVNDFFLIVPNGWAGCRFGLHSNCLAGFISKKQ